MVSGKFSFGLFAACALGLFSVGCLTKKSKEVATEGAAPPPAAYPESPAAYGEGSSASPYQTSSQPSAAPAPAAAPSQPAFQLRDGEQLVTHTIKSGENLSVIASQYNSSIRRIQAANGMTNTKIFAGKTLQVPTSAPPNLAMSTSPTATQAPAPAATNYGEGGRYGAIRPPATAPSTGVYPSTTTEPVPRTPAYPSTSAPAAPSTPSYSAPASTERIPSPPVQVPISPSSTSYPPQNPSSSGGAFPTPSFGGGSTIKFSD